MARLQGKEFQNVKHEYRIIGFIITSNGNIKVFLRNKNNYYKTMTHYLNDEEKLKFVNSEYFSKCRAMKKRDRYSNVRYSLPQACSQDGYGLNIVPKKEDISLKLI